MHFDLQSEAGDFSNPGNLLGKIAGFDQADQAHGRPRGTVSAYLHH